MNERIKELMELATVRVDPDDREWVFFKVDQDKFAELIIRECAKVCRNQSNEYAMELDRENCASAIEEHFRVEE